MSDNEITKKKLTAPTEIRYDPEFEVVADNYTRSNESEIISWLGKQPECPECKKPEHAASGCPSCNSRLISFVDRHGNWQSADYYDRVVKKKDGFELKPAEFRHKQFDRESVGHCMIPRHGYRVYGGQYWVTTFDQDLVIYRGPGRAYWLPLCSPEPFQSPLPGTDVRLIDTIFLSPSSATIHPAVKNADVAFRLMQDLGFFDVA